MALADFDAQTIRDFITYNTRLCFIDSKSTESKAGLFRVAQTASVSESMGEDVRRLVTDYLNNPLAILKNRQYIQDTDSDLIKLHIRLGIINYLKEESEIDKKLLEETEQQLREEIQEKTIQNKCAIVKYARELQAMLNNLHDNSGKIRNLALGVFTSTLIPASYLAHKALIAFNIFTIDTLLSVIPACLYTLTPLLITCGLALYSKQVEGDYRTEKQLILSALHSLRILNRESYSNMQAVHEEIATNIMQLEKEIEKAQKLITSYTTTTNLLGEEITACNESSSLPAAPGVQPTVNSLPPKQPLLDAPEEDPKPEFQM